MTNDHDPAEYVMFGLLSPKEREVYLWSDALDNEEIAKQLDWSEGAVRGTKQRIREKRREAQALVKLMTDV